MPNRALRRRLIRVLGSLPLIAEFARRLKIKATIDHHCPSRSNAHRTHGEVAVALIANRLTQPKALYRLVDWAEHWAVNETFGIAPEALNDDRLARCLDALAPKIDPIQGDVSVTAVEAFDLDLSTLFWDLTSMVLRGEYPPEEATPSAAGETAESEKESTVDAPTPESPAEESATPASSASVSEKVTYPQPAYGYGGERGCKQLRVGALVAQDGAIPLFHRAYDGQTADNGTVIGAMETFREHVTLSDCLVVGDSKIPTMETIGKLRRQGLHLLAPLPHSEELDKEYLSLDSEGWERLEYLAKRQERLPPEERTEYRGQEVSWEWTDPETGEIETFRRLYVVSSEEQATCRKVRGQQQARAEADLAKLRRGLGQRRLKTAEAVRLRVEQVLATRRVAKLYRVRIEGEGRGLTLDWEVDEEALAQAEALDGYYVLLCTWPKERADSSAVLRRWKQESEIERRYSDWKGPLILRPVFVATPRRIAALLLILHLALMIYCLLEREVRRRMAEEGRSKIPRLLAGHVAAIPTGENLLRAFEHLYLIVEEEDHHRSYHISDLSTVQAEVWRLLRIRAPVWCPSPG